MKFKPKGRKIYREKTRFERLRAFRSNTGAILVTVLCAGVLGFVGYSAGGPVLRFLQEQNVLSAPEKHTETTEAAQTALPETVQSAELTEPATEVPAPPQEAPTDPQSDAVMLEMRGVELATDALATEETLAAALNAVPAGTTHVLVPLKTEGGTIYFASANADVKRTDAVQAFLPIGTIYDAILKKGFIPVAVINTLEDDLYPQSFMDAAYRIAGSGDYWLDAPPEEGGKPWMSPFSELARQYLAELTYEIYMTGFQEFVCEGLTFPAFTDEQLAQLDPRCGAADRYTALADTVEQMQEAAPNATFYIGADGRRILNNESDVLSAAQTLQIAGVLLTVDDVTFANADLLRSAAGTVPCVLAWKTAVPTGETSYVQVMENEN